MVPEVVERLALVAMTLLYVESTSSSVSGEGSVTPDVDQVHCRVAPGGCMPLPPGGRPTVERGGALTVRDKPPTSKKCGACWQNPPSLQANHKTTPKNVEGRDARPEPEIVFKRAKVACAGPESTLPSKLKGKLVPS